MKRKRILGCIGILLAILLVLWGLGNLVEDKASRVKYHDFFAQQEDFDVLFFGTSHMFNAVHPLELWNDYGIVSYNYGGPANKIPVTYWVVKNALEYTRPKLVVVDAYDIGCQEKTFSRLEMVHNTFDAFPLSLTKCRAVFDLLDDPVIEQEMAAGQVFEGEKRVPMGLLWNFSLYHSRWTDLGKGDFAPSRNMEKGTVSTITVAAPQAVQKIPSQDKLEGETTGTQYLRRLIEDCRQEGIEVLLTYMPFPAEADRQREANRIADIAAEYGINSINFLDTDVINYDTDLIDANAHVNPSGARKITDYLGRYITGNYDIPDRRQDPAYSGWYEDYETYAGIKEGYMNDEARLDNYLMLLADKNYSFVFYLNDTRILDDAVYRALLKNIGVDTAQLAGAESWVITRQGGHRAQVWPVPAQGSGSWSTELGAVQLRAGAVTLDGETCLAAPGQENSSTLRAAVLAEPDHCLAGTKDFDLAAFAVPQ